MWRAPSIAGRGTLRLRAAARRSSSAASPAAAAVADESPTMRRLGALFFSGVCGGTACLCAWQLKRYQWKLDLIDERKAALQGESSPLRALIPEPAAGCSAENEYRRVAMEGTFDHSRQVLLGPRSAPAGSQTNTPAGAAGPSGWDVLTPLQCHDGTRVLVNRGWVARAAANQSKPAPIEQPEGVQRIDGILRRGEAENKYARNDPSQGRFVWLDLPAMAEYAGSAPLVVVAAAGVAQEGGERDAAGAGHGAGRYPRARSLDSFSEFHVKPSTHLTYAATWACLSAAGALITFKRFGPR
jgi:surfeit locus 1 family protein